MSQWFNILFFDRVDKHSGYLPGSLLVEVGVVVKPFRVELADTGRELVEKLF